MVTPSFHVRPTSVARLAGRRSGSSVAIVSVVKIPSTTATPEDSHRLRTLVLLTLLVGALLALRAAVADKGGSYDPSEARR